MGINPQFISFASLTMESEKYICVREEVIAYSHLLMKRTKEAHTPLSPQGDKGAAALSFVGRLVQAMYDLGVSAMPAIVLNSCHLLHDERCSLSPHHLILDKLLVPAMMAESLGLWESSLRPRRRRERVDANEEAMRENLHVASDVAEAAGVVREPTGDL